MPVVLVLRHANPVKKAQQHTKKLEKSSNEWMQANKYNRLVNIYFGFEATAQPVVFAPVPHGTI